MLFIFLFQLQSVNTAKWTIDSITNYLTTSTKLELGLHELADLMHRISSQNRLLKSFAKNHRDLEQITLQEFAQWVVSHNTMSIQGLLDRINALVMGSDELEKVGSKGVLQLVADNLQVNKLLCKHSKFLFNDAYVHRRINGIPMSVK